MIRVIVILAVRLDRSGLLLAAREGSEVRDGRQRCPRFVVMVFQVDVSEGHGELQQQREQRHRRQSPTLRPEPTHWRENPTGPHPAKGGRATDEM